MIPSEIATGFSASDSHSPKTTDTNLDIPKYSAWIPFLPSPSHTLFAPSIFLIHELPDIGEAEYSQP